MQEQAKLRIPALEKARPTRGERVAKAFAWIGALGLFGLIGPDDLGFRVGSFVALLACVLWLRKSNETTGRRMLVAHDGFTRRIDGLGWNVFVPWTDVRSMEQVVVHGQRTRHAAELTLASDKRIQVCGSDSEYRRLNEAFEQWRAEMTEDRFVPHDLAELDAASRTVLRSCATNTHLSPAVRMASVERLREGATQEDLAALQTVAARTANPELARAAVGDRHLSDAGPESRTDSMVKKVAMLVVGVLGLIALLEVARAMGKLTWLPDLSDAGAVIAVWMVCLLPSPRRAAPASKTYVVDSMVHSMPSNTRELLKIDGWTRMRIAMFTWCLCATAALVLLGARWIGLLGSTFSLVLASTILGIVLLPFAVVLTIAALKGDRPRPALVLD